MLLASVEVSFLHYFYCTVVCCAGWLASWLASWQHVCLCVCLVCLIVLSSSVFMAFPPPAWLGWLTGCYLTCPRTLFLIATVLSASLPAELACLSVACLSAYLSVCMCVCPPYSLSVCCLSVHAHSMTEKATPGDCCCLADECEGYGKQRQACNAVGLSSGICVNTTSAGQPCTKSHGEIMQSACDHAQCKQKLSCCQAYNWPDVVLVLQKHAVKLFMNTLILSGSNAFNAPWSKQCAIADYYSTVDRPKHFGSFFFLSSTSCPFE